MTPDFAVFLLTSGLALIIGWLWLFFPKRLTYAVILLVCLVPANNALAHSVYRYGLFFSDFLVLGLWCNPLFWRSVARQPLSKADRWLWAGLLVLGTYWLLAWLEHPRFIAMVRDLRPILVLLCLWSLGVVARNAAIRKHLPTPSVWLAGFLVDALLQFVMISSGIFQVLKPRDFKLNPCTKT